MIKVEINGKTIECEPGSMIIEAADNAGVYIPRFCYHKKLSIAANCRMCLVEVEKAPKTMPACATPVNDGMKVYTKSAKALEAQKYVLEFLLINHPLDCPICDQGGECELQDLSMGFGRDDSIYTETKRAVDGDDLGSLIATDMTRCIHCTRCVRFGREIAGVPELGLTDRGEHAKITTYIKHSLRSELSANIIDLCPVGALTSKPYRYSARSWELTQKSTIAPHDCVGSNIFIHTRRGKVMRVVPHDNEAVNETWISDRDRFSYLGLQHKDRLQKPMLKHQDQWQQVDWTKAFEYAAKGLRQIIRDSGAEQIGSLISPSATTEEAYLLQKIMRELGSDNIDYRIGRSDFSDDKDNLSQPLCVGDFSELSKQDCVFLIGSNVRREQPIVSNRVRTVTRHDANEGIAMVLNPMDIEFNFEVAVKKIVHPDKMVLALAEVAKALDAQSHEATPKAIKESLKAIEPSDEAIKMAQNLKVDNKRMLLLGALALNHPNAAQLKSLARVIALITGAKIIELTAGANSHGIHGVGATPKTGLNAKDQLQEQLKAYILFGIEPTLDCNNPALVQQALSNAGFVVAFSAYSSPGLLEHADIILPITPFSENDGTVYNAQGDAQTIRAAVECLGESRPGWKVLRVFGNMLELDGYQYVNVDDIKQEFQAIFKLENHKSIKIFETALEISKKGNTLRRIAEWPLNQCDAIVRRSDALQKSATTEKLVARIHENTAKSLNVENDDKVNLKQIGGVAEKITLAIDNKIPEDCVYIANGFEQSANLGTSFGEITIEKLS